MVKESSVVSVDEKWSSKFDIPRYSEGKGPQRDLVRERTAVMAKAFSNGLVCPPVLVGDVDGNYMVYDGQHRLEAWRLGRNFPLHAMITKMTKEQLAHNFVACNFKGIRVSLVHRLMVDPTPAYVKIRKLAEKYKASNIGVFYICRGMCNCYSDWEDKITTGDWAHVDVILDQWTKDKRWGQIGQVFSKNGILQAVGKICADKDSIFNILMCLKKMDYRNESDLAKILAMGHGTGGYQVKLLTSIMRDFLIAHV